jgi:hypothetical protein
MQIDCRPALRVAGLLFIVAMLGACATGPELRVSQDPSVDFSEFRSFGFMQDLGTDARGSRSMLSARLIAATTRELEGRGLQFVSNNPDLLVNFFSGLQTGIQATNMPIMTMPARNYGAWNGYRPAFASGQQITEGTLGVHVVERRSNRLVWEGIARDRLTEAMQDNADETVNSLIRSIFAEFPR